MKYLNKVEVAAPENKYMVRGSAIHKEIADNIRGGKIGQLPQVARPFIYTDKQWIEQKVMLDVDFLPTDKEEDCIILGYCDYATLKDDTLNIVDWKTGKSAGNKKQIYLYALYFNKLLSPKKMIGHFVYVDIDKVTKVPLNSIILSEAQDNILEEYDRINSDSKFVRNQGYKCRECIYSSSCFFDSDDVPNVSPCSTGH